jgi:hypothetical protein
VGHGHCKSRGLYFFLWKGNENHQFGTGFFVHHRIVTGVKRAEVVSDSKLFIVLRDHWYNIIFLNVHAPERKVMIQKTVL